MGVKLLMRPLTAKGAPPSSSQMAGLVSLIEDLCSSKCDNYVAQCQLMRQAAGVDEAGVPRERGPPGSHLRDLWLVQHSDARETMCLLNRSEHSCLEAEPGVLRLLERRLDYQANTVIRFDGRSYAKGDFAIRCFAVHHLAHMNQSFLGHALELEYLPAQFSSTGDAMLGDMVELLQAQLVAQGTAGGVATFEPIRPAYEKYGLRPDQPFGRTHAAIAYADTAVRILTATASSGAAAQAPALAQRDNVGTGVQAAGGLQ